MHQHSLLTSALGPVSGEISHHSRISPALKSSRFSLNIRLNGFYNRRFGRRQNTSSVWNQRLLFFGCPTLSLSLKRKLYKCNANIYFNQQCLQKQLIPTYAKIKSPIQHKIPNLHIKKQKLNQEIYHLHISLVKNLAIHPTHN
jgi:hypothetical protein